MKYIDSHSHLYDERYTEDERINILDKMKKEDIYTISISCDKKTSKLSLKLALENKNIYTTVGNHPFDNQKEIFDKNFYQKIIDKNKKKVVAVGECGLDYYYLKQKIKKKEITDEQFKKDKERQFKLFQEQIDFAVLNNLPLMLHIRSYKKQDAHKDALKILDEKQKEHQGKIKATFHFFTENRKIATEVIKRGYFISFPGVITFANLDMVVKQVPIEKILAETDSPYAAPVPYRGKNNNCLYIKEIVKKIAEIKNINYNDCNLQLIKNTKNFFDI